MYAQCKVSVMFISANCAARDLGNSIDISVFSVNKNNQWCGPENWDSMTTDCKRCGDRPSFWSIITRVEYKNNIKHNVGGGGFVRSVTLVRTVLKPLPWRKAKRFRILIQIKRNSHVGRAWNPVVQLHR